MKPFPNNLFQTIFAMLTMPVVSAFIYIIPIKIHMLIEICNFLVL